MRKIVLDPLLLLSGLIDPDGMRRRLLVLTAYGAAMHFERFAGPEEIERMQRESRAGAHIGGPDLSALLDRMRGLREAIADALPPLAPDDLFLAVSPALLYELERDTLREPFLPPLIPALNLTRPGKAIYVRRLVAGLAAIAVPEFDHPVPNYVWRGRKADIVVHTATQCGAYAVVTDDRDITQNESPKVYAHDNGDLFPAYRFLDFVEEEVNTLHFNLGDVDGRLLGPFLGALASQGEML